MLVRLRRDGANLALAPIVLALAAFALEAEAGGARLAALALLLAFSLWGWLRSVQHGRLIADTPTARIASAAQGYGELRGRGRPLPGVPVRSPVNGLPVLWYRVATYQRRGDGWEHTGTVTSDASFLLDDGTGVCAIDPEGAEVLVRRRDVHRHGDTRSVQWSLIDRDPIYAIGDFVTLGSAAPELDAATELRELLAHWKRNRGELLARFDLDGDGHIDVREWALARAQARREVAKGRREALAAPEAHLMRRPADGRLYLVSDLDPRRIGWRYRMWAAFHLAAFLGAAAAAAWIQARSGG